MCMKEIRCPNCGTTVPVDDLTYAGIVKQIRDSEFERELASRQDLAVSWMRRPTAPCAM